MNINFFYKNALAGIRKQPWERNMRTGVRVKAYPGLTYRTDVAKDGFPLLGLRKISMSFVPEVMWFLSGSGNIRPFLQRHTKIWDAFAEDSGEVTAAYGRRWDRSNQLWRAINGIRADRTTRQSVVVTWDIERDNYGQERQKNVPCPVMFTIGITQGRLNMHVLVRSNDMVLGFPTDVAGFALLQALIAQELKVDPGVYTHSISNAHYYENQEAAVVEMLGRVRPMSKVKLLLPADSIARAARLEDSLVVDLKQAFIGYEPNDPIRNIPIAI